MTPRGPERDDTRPEVAVTADGYVTLDGVILARIVGFGGDGADRVVAALRSALAALADARGDDATPVVVVNDNGAILIDGVHHGDVYSPRGRDALRAALATTADTDPPCPHHGWDCGYAERAARRASEDHPADPADKEEP